MNITNFKEIGSYSLILVIASNILLYSSALKSAHGDYYIAYEIMKSMSLQSWLVGNIATLSILFLVTSLPLFYYDRHKRIKHLQEQGNPRKIQYTRDIITHVTIPLTMLSLFIEFFLGFHGTLSILLRAILLLSITFWGIHRHFNDTFASDAPLKIASYIWMGIFLIASVYTLRDSAIIGQSCLLQVNNDKTEKIATIVPIEYSQESLKAIYLEHHLNSADINRQATYLAVRPIDETFSIYPRSCDSVQLNN